MGVIVSNVKEMVFISETNNKAAAARLWMLTGFIVLILGSNHSYGYSLLDSILDAIGIGSWTKEGQLGWHITSFITLPLLLLSMIQASRCLKDRYPNIFWMLLVVSLLFTAVFPTITEQLVGLLG